MSTGSRTLAPGDEGETGVQPKAPPAPERIPGDVSVGPLPVAPPLPAFPRPFVEQGPSPGLDLLEFGPVRRLILQRWFPTVIQASTLITLLALVVAGWGRFTPAGVDSSLFAKVDPVTLLTWGVWWPSLIVLTVLLGRVWCAVCPLLLTSAWGEALARKTGFRQLRLGRRLRTGALCLALYAFIQMLNAGVGLNRVPAYAALLFTGLLVAPFLVGFFFKDNAFCRGFCPVSLLLKTYGRGGVLAVRCKDTGHYDGERCPSLQNPARLASSVECRGCCQCIKTSRTPTMQLLLRRPFSRLDVRAALAVWPVTLFAMLDSGFVAQELIEEWAVAEQAVLWLPTWFSISMGWESMPGWIGGVWMLGVFPLLLWAALGGLVRLARGAGSMTEAWRRLALPMLVVSAACHVGKCLEKVASWGGYLPHALRESTGNRTASLITQGRLPHPAPLLSMETVSALVVSLLVVATFVALRESRLAHTEGHRTRVVPLVCASLLAIVVVLHW